MNTQKNYLAPFITMVFLFLIVGFLTVVSQQFQEPLKSAFLSHVGNIKNTLATMVTFAWFLAYPLTGGVGSKWVNRFGYKKTLGRALIIMIIGLIICSASAWSNKAAVTIGVIPIGFFIFLIGTFTVGSAATIMQVVINPYLAASEVKGTSETTRITIGGSANSTGTILAPYFVSAIVFGGVDPKDIKIDQVTIPFLLLAATIAVIAFIVDRLNLPDIEGTTNEGGEESEKSIWSFSHLKLGVIALFFYVGIEVAIGTNISMHANALGGSFAAKAPLMASLYWGGLLVGRLIGSTLKKISAQIQLMVTTIGATGLVLASIFAGNIWLLVGVGLMHSIMWSGIFSLAISKLGKYRAKASGALMIGVVGGAIIPMIQSSLADMLNNVWTWTWLIVVVGELYILYYALIGSKVKLS